MAIPIKAQLNIENTENHWVNIIILTDGSMYMVDYKYKMHPVDRSYAGQVIKEHMKHIATNYHRHMFQASLEKKVGDLVNADFHRGCAECIEVEYKEVKKFWNTFKNMSIRHNKEKKPDARTIYLPNDTSTVTYFYTTNTTDWLPRYNLNP
jgi:hypothetical protein